MGPFTIVNCRWKGIVIGRHSIGSGRLCGWWGTLGGTEVFAGLIQVAFDSGLGDGRVLVECCQSESSKFMDMAPSECLLQGGEGCAEEGDMSKCHKVSGGGTTKGGIGMEQHSKTVA